MGRSNTALAHVVGEKINGSIDAIPFQDREFDMLTSTEVLEHLPQDIYKKAKEEISRVAKQWIMVTVPYNESIELSQTICNLCHCSFNPNYHLRSFDDKGMRDLFVEHGFICSEIFKIHPQKKVPDGIERAIRSLGAIKRALLAQSPSPMRTNTICPACGQRSQVGNDHNETHLDKKSATLGMRIRSLLCVEPTYRWIGAVYERKEPKI